MAKIVYEINTKDISAEDLEKLYKFSVVKDTFSKQNGSTRHILFFLSGTEMKINAFHLRMREYTGGYYFIYTKEKNV